MTRVAKPAGGKGKTPVKGSPWKELKPNNKADENGSPVKDKKNSN